MSIGDAWAATFQPWSVRISGERSSAAAVKALRERYDEPSTTAAKFPALGPTGQDRWLDIDDRSDGSFVLAFFLDQPAMPIWTGTQVRADGVLRETDSGSEFTGWVRPSRGSTLATLAMSIVFVAGGFVLAVAGVVSWWELSLPLVLVGVLAISMGLVGVRKGIWSAHRAGSALIDSVAVALDGQATVDFDPLEPAPRPPLPTETLRRHNELVLGVRLELLTSRRGLAKFALLFLAGCAAAFLLLWAALAVFG